MIYIKNIIELIMLVMTAKYYLKNIYQKQCYFSKNICMAVELQLQTLE